MANIQRNFIAGRMNKSLDERLVPNGEYIDALNVRLGSTEESEIGAVENTKGNIQVTTLQYIDGTALSSSARCIGVYEDGANETIYWFVHDPSFSVGATGKLDLIVSYNVVTGSLVYHVVSINDGLSGSTVLNFNPDYLITGIDKIDDLLFFTDNLNPPRVINIGTNYPNPVSNIDQVTDEQLNVIKKPPTQSPTISLLQTSLEDSYLEDNFICFAYRYRYGNGEYSAISQFSEAAFFPQSFQFSSNSFLNEGMVNNSNGVTITYNSGSDLVTGVDLLFKEATDPTIKIIERIDKSKNGLLNNTNYTFTFTNSKIFTVLPEYEILRLYDNVPRLAKAQTIMNNRLVYGNYVEGYNLKDINNNDVNVSFSPSLISTSVDLTDLTTSFANSQYQAFGNTFTGVNNRLQIDFDGQTDKLKQGAQINFLFRFEFQSAFDSSGGGLPNTDQGSTTISFSYVLTQDYYQSATPILDLIANADFQARIGTATSIQTVANAQAGNGSTMTDQFNASLLAQLGTTSPQYDVYQTGISSSTATPPAKGEPIAASAQLPHTLQLVIPAAQYEETGVGTNTIIQYYQITEASASIQDISDTQSLHSNRSYEIGIVYMDEYNRSSTALVSETNTVNVPCSASTSKNEIQVTIPVSQRAPSWATRYKFVIKPDRENYETIYSSIFINDPNSLNSYLLLEGDNVSKVEEGDRLIVKRDANGPMQSCVYATVLEKKSQAPDFITPTSGNPVPGGTYMKMNTQDFSVQESDLDVINLGLVRAAAQVTDEYPVAYYNFYTDTGTPPTVTNTNYDIPAGTRIVMKIEQVRIGTGSLCEERTSVLEESFVASDNFSDMYDWFVSDNIAYVIENNATTFSGDPADPVGNIVISGLYQDSGDPLSSGAATNRGTESHLLTVFGGQPNSPTTAGDLLLNNYYRFYENTDDNTYSILVSGTRACRTGKEEGASTSAVSFVVYRRDSVIVFETEPEEALPDVWYENNLSFGIDTVGNHDGNVTNQDIATSQSGIVNTGFFNCYSFGNGVESYKIRDSITGKAMNLGNRVFTTSNVEYKEAHRFADLTYSGVYNDETNVNKLNEFNLGLLNFKPLEDSYGDIEILYGRKTDILTLQEDKISYVLAGKNILTDAGGASQLTSVPEVLGQQVARIEEFGISNNPESFAVWGQNKYFADVKRSAVVELVGSSASDEQLRIISEAGMRSWFRDLFTTAFTTQKLGGYDPYMNEYVFTSNTILKPEVAVCLACGVSKNITVPAGAEFIYCVDVTSAVGDVTVDYVIPREGEQDIITEVSDSMVSESGDQLITEGSLSTTFYTVQVIYNGITYTSGSVNQSGSITFAKDVPSQTQATVIVTQNSTENDTIEITVGCPAAEQLTIYSVCVTEPADAGKFIHNEFEWTDGATSSALQSDLVTFNSGTTSFVISQYSPIAGSQGTGLIPPDYSTVTMYSNKIDFDDFVFNPATDRFGFLRTNTFYDNNITDITSLLSAATTIPTNGTFAPTKYLVINYI